MYRKFVNARSPMRLLENGLHGGLGIGNVGALVAGHGVGKTPFLVGVGIDELLQRYEISDLTVEDPSIEAVIDAVFSSQRADDGQPGQDSATEPD